MSKYVSELYPQTRYLSKPYDRFNYRPIIITGYTDAISCGCFMSRIFKAGYKSIKKYKSYRFYEALPMQKNGEDIAIQDDLVNNYGHEPTFKISGEPITLKEYYLEIGYDYKTKKFNNKTLKKHIAAYMKD